MGVLCCALSEPLSNSASASASVSFDSAKSLIWSLLTIVVHTGFLLLLVVTLLVSHDFDFSKLCLVLTLYCGGS